MIRFVWKENGSWRYATQNETLADIWMPNENQVGQRINRYKANVSQKTLGTILVPDGNNKDQLKHMEKLQSNGHQKSLGVIWQNYLLMFQ